MSADRCRWSRVHREADQRKPLPIRSAEPPLYRRAEIVLPLIWLVGVALALIWANSGQ
jgi:hypothetical protein